MNIPGAAMAHAIITNECRSNRGVDGAFEEAVDRLRAAYEQRLEGPVSPDTEIHLVLVVQEARHR